MGLRLMGCRLRGMTEARRHQPLASVRRHGRRARRRARDRPRRGRLALGRRRQPLPRRLGEPLVLQRRPRPRRDRRRGRASRSESSRRGRSSATPRRRRRSSSPTGWRSCRRSTDAKIFLTTGGGDAIDTAAKLARLYWQVLGEPRSAARRQPHRRVPRDDGVRNVARRASRRTAPATGRSSPAPRRSQWDSPEALRDEIERLGPERVAAFFMEPVIGAGGVLPPPEGYIEAVAEICRDAGVLLRLRLRDLRLRPRRHLARVRALRRRARPGHLREGCDERLPAARRRRGLRPRRGAVLERARPGHGPPRPDLLRARGRLRGRAREHRHPRARGPDRRADASSRPSCSRRSRRSPTTRSSARCAAAPGRCAGIAFDQDALAEPTRACPRRRTGRSARTASSCARSARRSRSRRR